MGRLLFLRQTQIGYSKPFVCSMHQVPMPNMLYLARMTYFLFSKTKDSPTVQFRWENDVLNVLQRECKRMTWVGFGHPNSCLFGGFLAWLCLMYGCHNTSDGFLGFRSEGVWCKDRVFQAKLCPQTCQVCQLIHWVKGFLTKNRPALMVCRPWYLE